MPISKTVVLACLVFSAESLFAAAGWQPLQNISSVKVLPNGVELVAGPSRVRVLALAPNVVRIRYAQQGQFPAEHSFAVVSGAFPEAPGVKIEQSHEAVTLATSALQVK